MNAFKEVGVKPDPRALSECHQSMNYYLSDIFEYRNGPIHVTMFGASACLKRMKVIFPIIFPLR